MADQAGDEKTILDFADQFLRTFAAGVK